MAKYPIAHKIGTELIDVVNDVTSHDVYFDYTTRQSKKTFNKEWTKIINFPFPSYSDIKYALNGFRNGPTIKLTLTFIDPNSKETISITKDTHSSYKSESPDRINTLRTQLVLEAEETISAYYQKIEETKNLGANFKPTTHILEDTESEEIYIDSSLSSQEKYTQIMGEISEINEAINKNTALQDVTDLVDAFKAAKTEIEKLVSYNSQSIFGKAMGAVAMLPGGKKLVDYTQDKISNTQSVQDTINSLFGHISKKYENLIVVGDGLQKSKAKFNSKIQSLTELAASTDQEIAEYGQENCPMWLLALNTQIKANIEKYEQRMIKVNGAITAMQSTIIALGRDLPAMKSDLIDEMAISSLLNSVDDYQKMYSQIASLVTEVATSTSDKTHEVIEGLLDLQINDNHTLNYIKSTASRSEKFLSMVSSKSEKLVAKVKKDSEEIKVLSGTTLGYKEKTSSLRLLK